MKRRKFMQLAGATPLIGMTGLKNQPASPAKPTAVSIIDDFAPIRAHLQDLLLKELPEVTHMPSTVVGIPGTIDYVPSWIRTPFNEKREKRIVFRQGGVVTIDDPLPKPLHVMIHEVGLAAFVNSNIHLIDSIPSQIRIRLDGIQTYQQKKLLTEATNLWYRVPDLWFEVDRDILVGKSLISFMFHYAISNPAIDWEKEQLAWLQQQCTTYHQSRLTLPTV